MRRYCRAVARAELITESWVARAARLHPQRIAIDAPDGTLTYAQLAAGAALLAERLAARVRVDASELPAAAVPAAALRLPAGAAFALALHACLIAGVTAIPVDSRLPPAEQARRSSGASIELTDADLAAALRAPATTQESVPGDPADPVALPLAGTGLDAAKPAVRLYTSGTTGPGTRVELSRGALLWNAIGSAAMLGQPPGERWLSAMPVAHVGGLSVLARSAIGATAAVIRPRFDVEEQVALLQAGEATITSLVPTMLGRLLDAGLDHPPNLRLILLGGAPIAPALIERAAAAGVAVASTYGLSEASSQVLVNGRSLFCTAARLRGEPGAPLGVADEAGEVVVAGPTLATGAAGPGGWLATGDRGRREPATGAIAIVGRIAETIVTGGENVAPTEVEAALLTLPQIADAAVLGVPHEEWGEELQARVVLAAGASLDEAAIGAALRELLPPFAIPKRITAVDALPRTPTGKLVRRKLA